MRAWIGLGGNLPESRQALVAAVGALASVGPVGPISSLYRSAPRERTDQPDFLNAALWIATSLEAVDLMAAILGVEVSLGRVRAEKWGPRLIDIDILIYGGMAIDIAGLTIPHPRLTERAFALAPLVDVMPETVINGKPAEQWLAQLGRKGLKVVAGPEWAAAAG